MFGQLFGSKQTSARRTDVHALKRDLDARAIPVLVDVRTPEEYAAGHVPGAINLPLQALDRRLGELERYRETTITLICQSGGRSATAAGLLARAGYDVIDVAGGTGAWRAAGYRVE